MPKSNIPYPLQGLDVYDISSEGKAVARHEGLVVFIEGAVPGDQVDVSVYRKKNKFAEARVEQITRPSPYRVEPPCQHFGVCGGCKWQNLHYSKQLEFKQKSIHDGLTRIGHLTYPEPLPILGCTGQFNYRNKLEFTFSNRRWLSREDMQHIDQVSEHRGLGFHIPGLFDKVLDITHCHLQAEPSNAIRNAVRDYALREGLSFFDLRKQEGFLRTLMLRSSGTGEWMLVLSVFEWKEKELFALLEFLKQQFPMLSSIQYTHNPKGNDTLTGLDIKVYHGKDHIEEYMEGLRFKISPRSFYQTNSAQAYELYKITRDFAAIEKHHVVYDLYTGTGTIANFVASRAAKVIGVEYIEDAVKDAFENARINGINNTDFYAGDMKNVLNEDFVSRHGKADVIITDPPRAGMDPNVIEAIKFAAPERLVYVSCNPATQARDLALLVDQYRIEKMQAVDMFPQTAHVENVCLLVRNS
ncbi:MAG TPA: 23S rRNA (uracil(1939)-C(5))-methyltransferase RlmD [Bacteroidia bacterium]|nr:23S rRNA (uracil(1939)-C(5))-methyltransferase RlmD [Bacteroidia bacterium]